MVKIQFTPIRCQKLSAQLGDRSCGAVATFEGRVRDHQDGRPVTRLEYECYPAMTGKVLESLREECLRRWPIQDAWVVHRVGVVPLGEAAVWIGVASAHRAEAFEACRFLIERIKVEAPIWKRETYAGGLTHWVADCSMDPNHTH